MYTYKYKLGFGRTLIFNNIEFLRNRFMNKLILFSITIMILSIIPLAFSDSTDIIIQNRTINNAAPLLDMTGNGHHNWWDIRYYIHPSIFNLNSTSTWYGIVGNVNVTGDGHTAMFDCNINESSSVSAESNCYIGQVTNNGYGRAKVVHGTAVDIKGSHGNLAPVIGEAQPSTTTLVSRSVSAEDTGNTTGKTDLFYGSSLVAAHTGLDLAASTFNDSAIVLHSLIGDTHSSKIRATDGTYAYFDNNYGIHIGGWDGDHMIIQNGYQTSSISIIEPKNTFKIQAYNNTSGDYLRVILSNGKVPWIINAVTGQVGILDNRGSQCYLVAFPNSTMICHH